MTEREKENYLKVCYETIVENTMSVDGERRLNFLNLDLPFLIKEAFLELHNDNIIRFVKQKKNLIFIQTNRMYLLSQKTILSFFPVLFV